MRVIGIRRTGMTDTGTEELAALTARLVEFDSVNPALVPGGGGERAIALFVADWCGARGLEVEIVGEERTSVIARRRG
jgi:acetylornithine deacetylase